MAKAKQASDVRHRYSGDLSVRVAVVHGAQPSERHYNVTVRHGLRVVLKEIAPFRSGGPAFGSRDGVDQVAEDAVQSAYLRKLIHRQAALFNARGYAVVRDRASRHDG